MAKTNPFDFFRQVKAETLKITWPTRQEAIMSTIAVFIMATLIAIFLFFADQTLSFLVRLILGL